jgi:heme exporter protein D
MLIIALVLAVIGLVALVFAVVTSNELVAWVCIGASVLGVVLLIIDALRERQRRDAGEAPEEDAATEDQADQGAVDYPEEVSDERQHGSEGDAEESTVPADGGADEPAK